MTRVRAESWADAWPSSWRSGNSSRCVPSLSARQMWTALRRDGPNHLGIVADFRRRENSSRRRRPPLTRVLSFRCRPLSTPVETPATGRGGCSRMTVSPTAQVEAVAADRAATVQLQASRPGLAAAAAPPMENPYNSCRLTNGGALAGGGAAAGRGRGRGAADAGRAGDHEVHCSKYGLSSTVWPCKSPRVCSHYRLSLHHVAL